MKVYVVNNCSLNTCVTIAAFSSEEKAVELAKKLHESMTRLVRARIRRFVETPPFKVDDCSTPTNRRLCIDLEVAKFEDHEITVRWIEIYEIELDKPPIRL